MEIQRCGYHDGRNLLIKYFDGNFFTGPSIGRYDNQIVIVGIDKSRTVLKPSPFNVKSGIVTRGL